MSPRLSLGGKETNKESNRQLEPTRFAYNSCSNISSTTSETQQSYLQATVPSITREIAFFFLAGVGSTVTWTAVLSKLVYYTSLFGTISFPILNLAVYLPLLPILLTQVSVVTVSNAASAAVSLC
mmetsp:Transcript_9252/g.12351  ORF Transcript_9252/g.12351 Transcript_9252/m.12351 type:complete len:125 (+) Transcript_9252:1-375(+)